MDRTLRCGRRNRGSNPRGGALNLRVNRNIKKELIFYFPIMQDKMKDECCPKFNPKPWNGKIIEWKNKKFIKGKVFTLFYIPINFGGVMTKLMKKIDAVGVSCVGNLTLSEHTSKWNMNLYVNVDKKIPDAENLTVSGKFLSRVYEGDFKETGKWCKDFEEYAKNKKIKIKKRYMWYTTCPKCAKKWGKNYVVILAKVN